MLIVDGRGPLTNTPIGGKTAAATTKTMRDNENRINWHKRKSCQRNCIVSLGLAFALNTQLILVRPVHEFRECCCCHLTWQSMALLWICTQFFFLLISRIMSDESHYQPLMLTCNVPQEKLKRTENIFILALAITASALMLYSDKMRWVRGTVAHTKDANTEYI